MNYKSDVLFLYKKHVAYGVSFGLINSANFTCDALEKKTAFKVNCEHCVDSNEIDKYVTLHKPRICVLEALWYLPSKLAELQNIHKDVIFIPRVHSCLPFLSTEGTAIKNLKDYSYLENTVIAFNSKETTYDFKGVTDNAAYLPNIYFKPDYITFPTPKEDNKLRIGCFGASRQMKNQLIQAFAAIEYADLTDNVLHYYINANRVEQGDNIISNIEGAFYNTKHHLHLVDWMPHQEFVTFMAKMDISLQVSFTESFNIVTADATYVGVPSVVSEEISWTPREAQVNPNSMKDIANKIKEVLQSKNAYVNATQAALDRYNEEALSTWTKFINEYM